MASYSIENRNELECCRTFNESKATYRQETIKNYRERIRQAERSGEFALSEALRDIIRQEQDHEIDLKDALGL